MVRYGTRMTVMKTGQVKDGIRAGGSRVGMKGQMEGRSVKA